jgi:hypothetical protein
MLLVCNHDVISKDSVSSKGECPNYLSSESYLGPIWLAQNGPFQVERGSLFQNSEYFGQDRKLVWPLPNKPLIVKDAKWKKVLFHLRKTALLEI